MLCFELCFGVGVVVIGFGQCVVQVGLVLFFQCCGDVQVVCVWVGFQLVLQVGLVLLLYVVEQVCGDQVVVYFGFVFVVGCVQFGMGVVVQLFVYWFDLFLQLVGFWVDLFWWYVIVVVLYLVCIGEVYFFGVFVDQIDEVLVIGMYWFGGVVLVLLGIQLQGVVVVVCQYLFQIVQLVVVCWVGVVGVVFVCVVCVFYVVGDVGQFGQFGWVLWSWY